MDRIRKKTEKQNNAEKGKPIYIVLVKKLRDRALHNFGWKLLSLLCAFMVWMAIMNMEDPYVSVSLHDVPVKVLNEVALQEQGKVSDIEIGRTVDFTVRAPRSVAGNLTAADFEVTADYRQMSLVYAVPIHIGMNPHSSYANEDITIESKNPEMMQLTLEDYVQEPFRVDVDRNGDALAGFYVSNIVVKPNLVQIGGAKKQIERIARVAVKVDTTGARKSFVQEYSLAAYDKNGYEIEEKLLDFEVSVVEVEVTVQPVKKIPLVVVEAGTPAYGYDCVEIQYLPTEITISGSEEDLREISSLTIPVDVDMQSENVDAKLNIESFLTEYYGAKYVLVDEEKYATVKAYIEKMPTTTISVGKQDIEVRGLNEKYSLTYTTKSDISIKVLGPQEELDRLTVQLLRMYIDVTDYEPGSYYVSVYSDTEADVTVRTGTIGIEITEAKSTFAPENDTGEGMVPEDENDSM